MLVTKMRINPARNDSSVAASFLARLAFLEDRVDRRGFCNEENADQEDQ